MHNPLDKSYIMIIFKVDREVFFSFFSIKTEPSSQDYRFVLPFLETHV